MPGAQPSSPGNKVSIRKEGSASPSPRKGGSASPFPSAIELHRLPEGVKAGPVVY
jgi:hypothetical protein